MLKKNVNYPYEKSPRREKFGMATLYSPWSSGFELGVCVCRCFGGGGGGWGVRRWWGGEGDIRKLTRPNKVKIENVITTHWVICCVANIFKMLNF